MAPIRLEMVTSLSTMHTKWSFSRDIITVVTSTNHVGGASAHMGASQGQG